MDMVSLTNFLKCRMCKKLKLGRMYLCSGMHNVCEDCFLTLPALIHAGCGRNLCLVQGAYRVTGQGSKCAQVTEESSLKNKHALEQLRPRMCMEGSH